MIIPNIWENKKCSKPPTSQVGMGETLKPPSNQNTQALEIRTNSEFEISPLTKQRDPRTKWRFIAGKITLINGTYGGFHKRGIPKLAGWFFWEISPQ